MRRRLPPLNAVRAFEAAARHLSFNKAADELSVTPAAISQQVRALEEWLGVRLFRRQPRGVLLTDAGQLYLPALRDMLHRLAAVTRTLLSAAVAHVLTDRQTTPLAGPSLIPTLG